LNKKGLKIKKIHYLPSLLSSCIPYAAAALVGCCSATAHGVLQLLLNGNLFVLFTFLVWYKYSTQEIIRNDFLFLFRKKNLEADVCGVINGLDLGGAAMCVGRGDGSAEGSHIVTWALIQGGPQASDAGFFFSYFIPSIPFLFIVVLYSCAQMAQYSDAGGIGNPLFILFILLLKEEKKNRKFG